MDLFDQDWFVLQDPEAPGEHIVLQSLGLKLSPLWLSRQEAQGFAQKSPAAEGMLAQRLQSITLKESYLLALNVLGVNRVLIGYQPGMPIAASLDLAQTLGAIHHRMLPR